MTSEIDSGICRRGLSLADELALLGIDWREIIEERNTEIMNRRKLRPELYAHTLDGLTDMRTSARVCRGGGMTSATAAVWDAIVADIGLIIDSPQVDGDAGLALQLLILVELRGLRDDLANLNLGRGRL